MPDLGYTTQGASFDSIEQRIRGSGFTASEDGNASSMTAYLRETSSNSAHTCKCAVYSSGDALLGQTAERSDITLAGGWFTFSNSTLPNIANGSTYKLVAYGNAAAGALEIAYDSTGGSGYFDFPNNYPTFPNPVAWDTTDARRYSIYYTYTAAGGGTQSGVGTSDGVATVAGVGASTAAGAGSSDGVATVAGVGSAIVPGVGASDGAATVAGVGASTAAGAGSSDGAATAAGVGSSTGATAGTADGAATVTGVGAAIVAGAGSAAGTSTAAGVTPDVGVGFLPASISVRPTLSGQVTITPTLRGSVSIN